MGGAARAPEARGGPGLGLQLVPVAPEPEVRLPERGRALVIDRLSDVVLEIGPRGFDELVLVHPLTDALRPHAELPAETAQVVARLVDHAEVDEREPLGSALLDLVDRPLPGV